MQAARQWLFVFILTASLMGLGPAQPTFAHPAISSDGATANASAALRPALATPPARQPSALQTNLLELIGPTACPALGCAGGQRIGMRFTFDISGATYVAGSEADPNIQVCVFVSSSIASQSTRAEMAPKGEITGAGYTADHLDPLTCQGSIPYGYFLIGVSTANLEVGTPNDALRFAFRLAAVSNGTGSGVVIARVYAHNGVNWSQAASANSSILNMAKPPTANQVYVAKDASTCGVNSPCYVNSDGDVAGGRGTGLKDAVDTAPTTTVISVIGNYTVKANTVVVDQPLTLSGIDDATIIYSGVSSDEACSNNNPMLELSNTINLNNLNIDGGNCAGKRDLVSINSGSNTTVVTLESNDFHNGNNAIKVSGSNEAKVVLQFNEIKNNQGYAIHFDKPANPDSTPSSADITANNIYGNQLATPKNPPPQIDCEADATGPINTRKANHNYWGGGAPDPDATHCTIVYTKRLGMPIAHKTDSPGVNVDRVVVKGDKLYATDLDNQVAYKRVGGSDFDLYIVDHGYLAEKGPPFSINVESPSPCSNYWDAFIADSAEKPQALELYFKYFNKEGKTPGCLGVINTTQYCAQTTSPGKYPLFWLDPPDKSGKSVTDGWDPVGARPANLSSGDGQPVSCDTNANEIKVTIDGDGNSGRPSLSDLENIPFMVGIPVIKSFEPKASSQRVDITWSTNNEPDISGFRVWASGPDNPSPLSNLNGEFVNHLGGSLNGYTYTRQHSGLSNGSIYYYQLEVIRTDGYSFYSDLVPIKVNVATPTPTRTPTTVLPTSTRPYTPYPTSRPTSIPSKTSTPRKTWTPTATYPLYPTLTSTIDLNTPGAYETLTAIASTEQYYLETTGTPPAESETPGASLSRTPGTPGPALGSGTPSPVASATRSTAVAGESTKANPWVSLLLGLLAGLVVVGGVGRWWYTTQK